ncbi:copper transporter [Numidum massiliense]|uniref:copper transporter n=1 Tax=Numidum massiliense TaxID=1522315 RepID=UPI0006D56015|nr:copper transporter [Numidum massiliense]
MISTRYHLFTVMAIFLSLGVGILLGGSLGQKWLSEQKQSLMAQLERRYEEQVTRNRQLVKEKKAAHTLYARERQHMAQILQLSLARKLQDRFFVVFSANPTRAARLERMIRWAGGRVQVRDSLSYTPVKADGVIVLGDDFADQMTPDVLQHLQVLYRGPLVVHRTTFAHATSLTAERPSRHVYFFEGPLSEVVDAYKLLNFLHELSSEQGEQGDGDERRSRRTGV